MIQRRLTKPLGVPELHYLGDVQRLELREHDVLVISVPQPISEQQAHRLKEHVRAALGDGHAILVFDNGIKLGVLSPQ